MVISWLKVRVALGKPAASICFWSLSSSLVGQCVLECDPFCLFPTTADNSFRSCPTPSLSETLYGEKYEAFYRNRAVCIRLFVSWTVKAGQTDLQYVNSNSTSTHKYMYSLQHRLTNEQFTGLLLGIIENFELIWHCIICYFSFNIRPITTKITNIHVKFFSHKEAFSSDTVYSVVTEQHCNW